MSMTEAKPEPNPVGQGGVGQEKNESAGVEVSGRAGQLVFICPQCGAQNYADANWTWVTCWKCQFKKPVPLPGN
jgi:predicted RNA-binding Zn-ribbon protein involved in translation (DUF1610 family)